MLVKFPDEMDGALLFLANLDFADLTLLKVVFSGRECESTGLSSSNLGGDGWTSCFFVGRFAAQPFMI